MFEQCGGSKSCNGPGMKVSKMLQNKSEIRYRSDKLENYVVPTYLDSLTLKVVGKMPTNPPFLEPCTRPRSLPRSARPLFTNPIEQPGHHRPSSRRDSLLPVCDPRQTFRPKRTSKPTFANQTRQLPGNRAAHAPKMSHSHSPALSSYGDCVDSLRTSLTLLESSVDTLGNGVADFPRLASVLKTVRVCILLNIHVYLSLIFVVSFPHPPTRPSDPPSQPAQVQ